MQDNRANDVVSINATARPLRERYIMRNGDLKHSGCIAGFRAGRARRGVKWRLQFSFALFIIPSSKLFGLRPIRLRGLGHCYFWRLPPHEAQAVRKN